MYHVDPEINGLMAQLFAKLRDRKRETNKGCVLLFIPHTPEESVITTMDGALLATGKEELTVLIAVGMAFQRHGEHNLSRKLFAEIAHGMKKF